MGYFKNSPKRRIRYENPEHLDEDGPAALDNADRAQFEMTNIDGGGGLARIYKIQKWESLMKILMLKRNYVRKSSTVVPCY